MGDPVDKARKLLALTVNPNENEAKLAAWRLAQLLVKHDLTIASADALKAAERPYPSAWGGWEYTSPPPPPRPRRDSPKYMATKYNGRCKGCRCELYVGEMVYWCPKDGDHPGVWCSADCYPAPF